MLGLTYSLYQVGIRLYGWAVWFVARILGQKKAQLWLEGRKTVFEHLESSLQTDQPRVWLHAASLGEFEQGRPILSYIRAQYPNHLLVLTFFSPSGYEVRKNYSGVDLVTYLPLDTKLHAQRFLDIVKPELAIFVKYEFWYHYLTQLQQRHIPTLLISAAFRPDQIFFRSYGKLFRQMLAGFNHIFVQTASSLQLLQQEGFSNVSFAGDTRFDRVSLLPTEFAEVPGIAAFVDGSPVLVAGSSWPAEESILAACMQNPRFKHWKVILAPHEISENHLQQIEKLFPNAVRYSQLNTNCSASVLIIDNVGMLTRMYAYAKVAFVGGGYGKAGLHNILEPAAYGVPVLIGPHYRKHPEASQMLQMGGLFVAEEASDLVRIIESLDNSASYAAIQQQIRSWVAHQKGAAATIQSYIEGKRFLTKA
jgi:3-deoxy-D-manno-octulosonic-acid transferase